MNYRYSQPLDLLEQLNLEHWGKRIRQLKYEFAVGGDRPVYAEDGSNTGSAPPNHRYGVNRHWGRYRRSYAPPSTQAIERPILRREGVEQG